jgi:hypothetical protein
MQAPVTHVTKPVELNTSVLGVTFVWPKIEVSYIGLYKAALAHFG